MSFWSNPGASFSGFFNNPGQSVSNLVSTGIAPLLPAVAGFFGGPLAGAAVGGLESYFSGNRSAGGLLQGAALGGLSGWGGSELADVVGEAGGWGNMMSNLGTSASGFFGGEGAAAGGTGGGFGITAPTTGVAGSAMTPTANALAGTGTSAGFGLTPGAGTFGEFAAGSGGAIPGLGVSAGSAIPATVGANFGTSVTPTAASLAGPTSMMSRLGSYLPSSGTMQSLAGLYGLYASNQMGNQAKTLDPMAQYRAGYASQLQNLMSNPSSITGLPGYQAGIEAIMRNMASQGYTGSGNMMAALQQYGGQAFQNQLGNLSGLAGVNISPAVASQAQQSANMGMLSSLGLLGTGFKNLGA